MIEERRVPLAEADPYLLFGLLGKQVIHPGGRRATEELFAMAKQAGWLDVKFHGLAMGTVGIVSGRR